MIVTEYKITKISRNRRQKTAIFIHDFSSSRQMNRFLRFYFAAPLLHFLHFTLSRLRISHFQKAQIKYGNIYREPTCFVRKLLHGHAVRR